ncbi:unnamed protein product [Prorocentrum cordatum]|uniref:Uncharacterized protein n=1 Tax=Prorocentrum cordatum TaxID=2364126 RepID=A0ABN9UTZ2_9DINO|nr:unnamed protein product [Polarella glacialis]
MVIRESSTRSLHLHLLHLSVQAPWDSNGGAGISACEKAEQWQPALALLSEMGEAKLEPNVISYSAGISACEKGEQWQRALTLLSEMWKGEQWQRALALLSEMASSGSGRWRC